MNENTVYWLWLQDRLGPASRYVINALEQPGRARCLYECVEEDLWMLGCFPYRVLQRLCDKSLDKAHAIMDACARLGYEILTPEDVGYPRRLLTIDDPPAALYVSGKLPDIDKTLCAAIVGTRQASPRGAAIAALLAARLTRAGCLVISGAAYGIDEAAHTGALNSKGRTVAVLGCGIDYRYNIRCETLREVISHNGALVSEYPPGTPPSRYTFPIRNRIISGLSNAVTVVEAGIKSGSVNTAGRAAAQNRDVFAVPAPMYLSNYGGVKKLLDDGAFRLETVADLLGRYSERFGSTLCLSEECFLPLDKDIFTGGTLNDLLYGSVYMYGNITAEEYPAARKPDEIQPVRDFWDMAEENVSKRLIGRKGLIFGIGRIERTEELDIEVDELYGRFIPAWAIPFPNGVPQKAEASEKRSKKATLPEAETERTLTTDETERTFPSDEAEYAFPPDRYDVDVDYTDEKSDRGEGEEPLSEEVPEEAASLLAVMPSEPCRAEELAAIAGIPYRKAAALLTELELCGAVKMYTGKRYAPAARGR